MAQWVLDGLDCPSLWPGDTVTFDAVRRPPWWAPWPDGEPRYVVAGIDRGKPLLRAIAPFTVAQHRVPMRAEPSTPDFPEWPPRP